MRFASFIFHPPSHNANKEIKILAFQYLTLGDLRYNGLTVYRHQMKISFFRIEGKTFTLLGDIFRVIIKFKTHNESSFSDQQILS